MKNNNLEMMIVQEHKRIHNTKDTIIKVGDKFISEINYSYLVDADTKDEATLFTSYDADQIIAYLGEGEKVLINAS